MSMSTSLENYLHLEGVAYELIHHIRSKCSLDSAHKAHIPRDQMAKCVVLEDQNGYMLAAIPATSRVNLGAVHHKLDRMLGLATEKELTDLFRDCEPGAVPPIGKAYGYDVIVDDSLLKLSDIYFEAGDHKDLVHMEGNEFRTLMSGATHDHICH